MKKVEVEGGELALKNSFGDIVIIPKKNRLEVEGMIKDNCWGCIDAFVDTLPVMEDYAGDGSLFPDWDKVKSTLNPKNWGVTDYTDKFPNKDKAFAAARKAGEKEYLYNNVRYTTYYAGTPQQQLKETGLTNEQLQNRGFISNRLAQNLHPRGYDKPVSRVYDAVVKNNKDSNRNLELNSRMDAYNLYMGLPQTHNTFEISKYKPTKGKNEDVLYYKKSDNAKSNWDTTIGSKKDSEHMLEFIGDDGKLVDESIKSRYDDIAGNYTINLGKDDNGKYISYYDKWDLNPFSLENPLTKKEITTDIGKPFEIYDRVYYRDNPKYTKDYIENRKKLMQDNDLIESYFSESGELISKQIPGTFNNSYTKRDGQKWEVPKEFEDIHRYLDYIERELSRDEKKYIQQYYSDKELSELDVNKKNFDTLALQKELSNRGIKFEKSIKKDGSFDGIFGDETKNALLNYQSKNKKK